MNKCENCGNDMTDRIHQLCDDCLARPRLGILADDIVREAFIEECKRQARWDEIVKSTRGY